LEEEQDHQRIVDVGVFADPLGDYNDMVHSTPPYAPQDFAQDDEERKLSDMEDEIEAAEEQQDESEPLNTEFARAVQNSPQDFMIVQSPSSAVSPLPVPVQPRRRSTRTRRVSQRVKDIQESQRVFRLRKAHEEEAKRERRRVLSEQRRLAAAKVRERMESKARRRYGLLSFCCLFFLLLFWCLIGLFVCLFVCSRVRQWSNICFTIFCFFVFLLVMTQNCASNHHWTTLKRLPILSGNKNTALVL
jgi:hypothetical protein